MSNDRVVITGVGLVSSLGLSLEETWNALVEGRTGIGPIKGFPAEGFQTKTAAQVDGLDPKELGIKCREARITDMHTHMLIKCLRDAVARAGLEDGVPRDEIAFFGGMGGVDYRVEDLLPAIKASVTPGGEIDYDKFYTETFREIYPLWPLGMLNNIAFCQAGIVFGLRGENTVFSPHAEAGAQALREAALSVAEGKAPVALAAGVSEKVAAPGLARGVLSGIMGADTCRPFSSERDGTILGEGCAVLALGSASAAKERGVPPLARIAGYGEAFATDINNSSEAISRAMRAALESAEVRPSDIDVLIAHGDGTPQGDAGEIEAINEVFSGTDVKVYSSKGALGHMLAASPVVDAALAVQMVRTGNVPPTLNARPLDEGVKFDVVIGESLRIEVKRVMIECTSVEGQCAALVVEAP